MIHGAHVLLYSRDADADPWGRSVTFRLPGGSEVGLYQPRHPTALGLASTA